MIFRFGPFELDSSRRILNRGAEVVWLPDRQMNVLLILASAVGNVVSKEALIEAAWQGLAVTDNSIVQAIR